MDLILKCFFVMGLFNGSDCSYTFISMYERDVCFGWMVDNHSRSLIRRCVVASISGFTCQQGIGYHDETCTSESWVPMLG